MKSDCEENVVGCLMGVGVAIGVGEGVGTTAVCVGGVRERPRNIPETMIAVPRTAIIINFKEALGAGAGGGTAGSTVAGVG